MIHEQFQAKTSSLSFNVTQTQIDSIRKKSLTKTGCRVYADGVIGISGCFGEPKDETWATAEKNLARRIPYPYAPGKDAKRTRDLREAALSDAEYLKRSEELLERLRKDFPDFIFSNKIEVTETEVHLKNDAELDLQDFDRVYAAGLMVKHHKSIGICDYFTGSVGRTCDFDAFYAEALEQVTAFRNPLALPQGKKLPVVVDYADLSRKFEEALNGELLGRGVSLLNGKVGETVFNDRFSLLIEKRGAESFLEPFFDMEGSVLAEDHFRLIDHGKIVCGYADKKTAALYGTANTAAAGGDYDSAPTLASPSLTVAPSEKTLAELIGGREAIYIAVTSGGDFNNEGLFAAPVQMAFLMREGKMVGRLPEFSISGNLFDLFGEGFIGQSADRPIGSSHMLAVEMNVDA